MSAKYFVVENTHRNPANQGSRWDVISMASIEHYRNRPIKAENLELGEAFARVRELEAKEQLF